MCRLAKVGVEVDVLAVRANQEVVREWGLYPQSTVAPTPVETWRFRAG